MVHNLSYVPGTMSTSAHNYGIGWADGQNDGKMERHISTFLPNEAFSLDFPREGFARNLCTKF